RGVFDKTQRAGEIDPGTLLRPDRVGVKAGLGPIPHVDEFGSFVHEAGSLQLLSSCTAGVIYHLTTKPSRDPQSCPQPVYADPPDPAQDSARHARQGATVRQPNSACGRPQ